MRKFGALVALLALLLVSAGLDLAFYYIRDAAYLSFKYGGMVLGYLVFPMIWAVLVCLLAWWTLRRGRNVIVSLLFILVGLAVHLLPTLPFAGATLGVAITVPFRELEHIALSLLALTNHTGTLAVVIGVAGLVPGRASQRPSA